MAESKQPALRVLLVIPLERHGLCGGQARAGSILREALTRRSDVELYVVEHPHRTIGEGNLRRAWARLCFFSAYLVALLVKLPHVVHFFTPAGYWAVLEKTTMAVCARGIGATTLLNLRSDPRMLMESLSESRRTRIGRALRRPTGVICQFKALKAFYTQRVGLDPTRVFVVPNALAHRDVTLTAADCERRFVARRVAFLGSVQPQKGLFTLLGAIALSRDEGLAVCVDVIGEFESAEYRAHLEQRCNELRLNELVTFHGPRFGSEKESLLDAVSALVLPSRSEGFPNVVLEAAQLGLPVICSRTGAAEDISEALGIGIQLFEVDAEDQLAAALLELFNHPGTYPRRAEAALAGVAVFSTDNMCDGFLAAYRAAHSL